MQPSRSRLWALLRVVTRVTFSAIDQCSECSACLRCVLLQGTELSVLCFVSSTVAVLCLVFSAVSRPVTGRDFECEVLSEV